jgi:hypothetical protein
VIGLHKYFWSLAVMVAVPAVLAAYGLWMMRRNPVPDGGDATLHVPAACVVTARRAYRLPEDPPTVARNQRIGRTLLVIGVGACLLFLAVIYLAVIGEGC